jgi:hypothetical protein
LFKESEVSTMEATNIVREIASLPPEAQRQVADFVAFLKDKCANCQENQANQVSG